jgi:2-oxoglutarate dehydrogenase E1 component
VEQGHLSREAVDALVEERYRRYEESLAEAKRIVAESTAVQDGLLPVPEPEDVPVIPTGIDLSMVRTITEAISSVPMHFHLNPKIVSLVSRRARMASGEVPCDWGFAEGLAFGSLVLEGTPVRLTGEDSQRGTFSQRHAVFVDALTGDSWLPLRNLSPDQADIQIFDSPLSEAGVLGFEYGYSVDAPHALVLWEAQFGDFLNAAQVAVDQFIAPGETKWNQKSRLVLLLPHGYEGQGPEHSSARLERFLQLAAEQNMRICLPSTPAQYFHMLRRQMRQEPKPLIVMTPKSLLRLPEATSSIEEITSGGFQAVLADRGEFAPGRVRRLVFCTGKVYYDITSERGRQHLDGVAVVRLEQLYPFPAATVAREAARLGSPAEVVWAQEEPRNMGAWSFVQPRLVATLGRDVGYAGRAASASTAIGSHKIHVREQQQLVADALGVR